MRHIFRMMVTASLFFTAIFLSTYCSAGDVAELVDQFKKSTDLQQTKLVDQYMFRDMSGKGVVANVEEYDAFDLTSDTRSKYYKVVTAVQNTPQGNPYIVSFFYKTKDEVKDIAKGEPIEKTGAVLKILDERLWVTVWLYTDDVGPQEKLMFGPPGAEPAPPDMRK